jgi:hypothetical protein
MKSLKTIAAVAMAAGTSLAIAQPSGNDQRERARDDRGQIQNPLDGNTPAGGLGGTLGGDSARPGVRNSPVGFSDLDKNMDGSLSQSEIGANAGLKARFRDLDVDRDGNLSSSEFSAFEAPASTGAKSGTKQKATQKRNKAGNGLENEAKEAEDELKD